MPLTTEQEARDDSHGSPSGWLTSLAFWICLLTAAGLYAAVALSPRYLANLNLHRRFLENHWQLVALERQTRHLEQVTAALKNDPGFARELARMDFQTGRPDEQHIPVGEKLSLIIRPAAPDLAVSPPSPPPFAPLLQLVTENHTLADALLSFSAGLVILAFTFLQDRGSAPACDPDMTATDGTEFNPVDSDPHSRAA